MTDGTGPGTRLVKDINPGEASGDPQGLVALGTRVAFFADDGTSGSEPRISDGTDAGTTRIADLNPGPGSSGSWRGMYAFGRLACFGATEPVTGTEPYCTDGTEAGTVHLSTPRSASRLPRPCSRIWS